MFTMEKFPWTQYLSSLLFYIVIAAVVFVLASLLPTKAPEPITKEQLQTAQEQQAAAQSQQVYQQILAAAGRLMVLPNVAPEILVVDDVASFLKQNPTFVGISAGDVVLVYPNRVIAYSPQFDRIVHVTERAPGSSTPEAVKPDPVETEPEKDAILPKSN